MTASALLLDFDGLIIDTETSVYESWRRTFVDLGAEPIDRATWATGLGRPADDPLDIDPVEVLAERLDGLADLDVVQARRRTLRDELLAGEPVRPGVEVWIDTARSMGLPVAVCSSSPTSWVEPLLADHGLRDRIDHVSCAGDGVPGKPDPAVYLNACAVFGVDPARAVAVDDTPVGIRAAKGAGARAIAVSANMTAGLAYPDADLVVGSLADLEPVDVLGSR
ncbi:MAG: HAD family phosphatase [Actinomycetota bacterium]